MEAFRPELLAPAGSLDKLKTSVLYGADAVYLGGQNFGLRSAADNFTTDEIFEGVAFAHERGSQVYVVLNSFLHDQDLDGLPDFLAILEEAKVDAVIVSDLGVIETIKNESNLEIHLSTQASCLNVEAAKLWKKMGVTRVVLGREVSIAEAGRIKEVTGLEMEMFIHGSMCMAYSGNCVISNYTQGRDSNRGGCAHSCRFEYSLDFEETEFRDLETKRAFFMSSKDLEGVKTVPDFFKYKIDSLKVEGRMKSQHYAGTISKVYKEAIDCYYRDGLLETGDVKEWEREVRKVTHRSYADGSLVTPADRDTIYDEREHNDNEYVICGTILEVVEDKHLLVEVRAAFHPGDMLELVPFKERAFEFKAETVTDFSGETVPRTKPGSLVKVPYVKGSEKWNLIRRQKGANE